MAGLSRAGILVVVLAACGGGQRAGQSDSAAVATGAAPMDTTAMAPTSASHDSMTAPTAAAPADTGAVSTAEAAKPAKAAESTAKPSAPATSPTAKTPAAKTPTAKTSSVTTPTAKTSSATTPTDSAPAASTSSATTPSPAATAPTAASTITPAAQDSPKKAAAQDTTKKAAAANASTGGTGTPQQIALGDSIFHGQVGGGTCSACHGQDAKGTAVAPDLTDSQWLNGDGSYQFLVNTITNGVPQPKQHPAPMPPKGGAPLTDDQVKAVAAYEYSLSHKS